MRKPLLGPHVQLPFVHVSSGLPTHSIRAQKHRLKCTSADQRSSGLQTPLGEVGGKEQRGYKFDLLVSNPTPASPCV